jgi:hypothetical protein
MLSRPQQQQQQHQAAGQEGTPKAKRARQWHSEDSIQNRPAQGAVPPAQKPKILPAAALGKPPSHNPAADLPGMDAHEARAESRDFPASRSAEIASEQEGGSEAAGGDPLPAVKRPMSLPASAAQAATPAAAEPAAQPPAEPRSAAAGHAVQGSEQQLDTVFANAEGKPGLEEADRLEAHPQPDEELGSALSSSEVSQGQQPAEDADPATSMLLVRPLAPRTAAAAEFAAGEAAPGATAAAGKKLCSGRRQNEKAGGGTEAQSVAGDAHPPESSSALDGQSPPSRDSVARESETSEEDLQMERPAAEQEPAVLRRPSMPHRPKVQQARHPLRGNAFQGKVEATHR